jgi:hypothetical protein
VQWSIADIADAVADGLGRHAGALEREQAKCGLDGLEEVALHPILAEALAAADYGVYREQRYPSDRGRRRLAEGQRCDLVLTPAGRELRAEDTRATLFDDPDAVDLDAAFWLEVKTVAQFLGEGPNPGYSSNLLSTVGQDVTKLSRDPEILHAALLILLFVHEKAVADHDLGIWQDRCLERGLPIGAPSRREVEISDRVGNRVCAVALYPVGHY